MRRPRIYWKPGDPLRASILSIPDGDGCIVADAHREISIRIYGIDAPEMNQPYGAQARDLLVSLTRHKPVIFAPVTLDLHGRTVAHLYLPDGRRLSNLMVEAGAAWWYKRFATDEHILRQLEQYAREHHLGLWRLPNPTPPWIWRLNHPAPPHPRHAA